LFIEFIIDGADIPVVLEVGHKAKQFMYELERKKKKWRFGKALI